MKQPTPIFARLAPVHLVTLIALTSGCTSTAVCERAAVRSEYQHVSHITAGPPFGPKSDEDSLDVFSVLGRCEIGRVYAEAGVGLSLADGGFYGPDEIFTGRVGVEFWKK